MAAEDNNLTVTTTALGSGLLDEVLVVTDPVDYEAPRKPEAVGEHLVASTTDSARALETGKPIPLSESSLSEYRQLEGDGVRVTSYESPDSSRRLAQGELEQYQRDLDRLKFPDDTELIQQLSDETGVQLEPETPAQPEAQTQQPSVPLDQVQEYVEGQVAVREHQQRLALAMADPQFAEFFSQLPPSPVVWDPKISIAVASMANSPAVVAFLSAREDVARQIAAMPTPRAVSEVAKISAWLHTELTGPAVAPAPRRAVSNAPAPIRPVGGSATKSSQPPGEMTYQDFKRYREKSIREHRRGER